MSELSFKILHLIEEGFTINDICSSLSISRKQLGNILRGFKLLGIEFNKRYYYDGEMIYVPKKDLTWETKKNTVNIITSPTCREFKAMYISDLHAGNELDDIDAWHKIYDYCIAKNIHIIVMAGDFLDGINIGKQVSKKHCCSLDQIRYAVNNYPFDKNIINFVVLGNHDVDSLVSDGIDFATYLRNFRSDIVPLGYGHGRINVKNDKIFVTHPLNIGLSNNIDLTGNYFLVKGHHHNSKFIIGSTGNCSLNLPTLSRLFISDDYFLPGATVITTDFKNGYFDTIYIENLLINHKVNVVSTTQFSVVHSKDRKNEDHIKFEEDFSKRKRLKK